MTLIVGDRLASGRFFSSGSPRARGSSFDLRIGAVFDTLGNKVEGPFVLKPGHMVQVISAEVFDLADNITGHVTYKMSLTRQGIWALTVGIVDPGWKGPVSTTLLNFSRIDYAIAPGDPFLRVSFYEHAPVSSSFIAVPQPLDDYIVDLRKISMSRFAETFLDQNELASKAGGTVLNRIRKESLVWVAAIAIIFSLIQLTSTYLQIRFGSSTEEINKLQARIEGLEQRLAKH
jgi:dUTPase